MNGNFQTAQENGKRISTKVQYDSFPYSAVMIFPHRKKTRTIPGGGIFFLSQSGCHTSIPPLCFSSVRVNRRGGKHKYVRQSGAPGGDIGKIRWYSSGVSSV